MHFDRAVIAPNLTPFNADFSPDKALYIAHAKRLLGEGCAALAPFGTTGEAASLGMSERMALLEAMIGAGIAPDRLIPGTGLTALTDTVTLCRHALGVGVSAVMVLPPFYYKDVSDQSLYEWFSRLVEGVGQTDLKLYLYHIPPVAKVGFSVPLVQKLARNFPGIIVGIKDSGGDWDNTAALLAGVPNFAVLPGNELRLARSIRSGARGCITATANVNAPAIAALAKMVGSPDATARDADVDRYRLAIQRYRPIPAMKAMLARRDNHLGWHRVRPPLEGLSSDSLATFEQELQALC